MTNLNNPIVNYDETCPFCFGHQWWEIITRKVSILWTSNASRGFRCASKRRLTELIVSERRLTP